MFGTRFGFALMLAAAVTLAAMPAGAADGEGGSAPVTASLTAGAIGSRSVATVNPIVLASVIDSAQLTTSYSISLTESARTGTNPWSVVASMTPLSDGLGNSIDPAAMTVSDRAVLQTASGGVSSAPLGPEDLSASRTLFTNAGQDTSTLYTGSHTATGTLTLTPPNGTVAGVYTGTFTVTLTQ